MRKRFTKEEATGKVNQRVRSLAEFFDVPQDTTGVVVRADYMGKFKTATEEGEEYNAVIQWDLPERPFGQLLRPLQDWFTAEEYSQYLQEIDTSDPATDNGSRQGV